MARGALTENERQEVSAKSQQQLVEAPERAAGDGRAASLRVRFLDEEGKTERLLSADEVDCAPVHKIHILKNKSSSETSIMLRHPSMASRRRRSSADAINNNNLSSKENLNNGTVTVLKFSEWDKTKTENGTEKTKETNGHYKKNCNVYSVNQAKTLTPERKKSIPLTMPRLMKAAGHEGGGQGGKSTLPQEVSLAEAAFGRELTARALGRLSRGLGRLLRRTNSVRISEPDPVYKVAYLGNVLTGWARGESCIEKPLATLWRNYQQSTKPDVVMKLSVTNSGLKGFTKEHGLTEYWSHRVTYCASPPHYPRLFCWVYRHEGKKLKHELRCHAVLCAKENVSKKITEELQVKLKQALVEFKKDRIAKQNARLSLANSVYDNPSMPRRKILLSVGALNYRPPLERSKSAPKLGAIEELCSEEDEEEAEMKAPNQDCDSWRKSNEDFTTQTLDRRRPEMRSPRKLSCPEGVISRTRTDEQTLSDELTGLLIDESKKSDASQERFQRLESIDETSESALGRGVVQSALLVTDSDDGSVSSGCETASTAASDSEPSSLPHFPPDAPLAGADAAAVNCVPIGEKNTFRRRCTYPPLGTDSSILTNFENKFESLTDTLTDFDSLTSCGGGGDDESACSDESGYSELLDGKESAVGATIMV